MKNRIKFEEKDVYSFEFLRLQTQVLLGSCESKIEKEKMVNYSNSRTF